MTVITTQHIFDPIYIDMFNEVKQVYRHWVSEQLLALADIQMVIASVDLERGVCLQRFIDRLPLLDGDKRDALLRDPMLCRWVGDLRSMAIAAYSGAPEQQEALDFASIVTLMELALAALSKTELEFVGLFRQICG